MGINQQLWQDDLVKVGEENNEKWIDGSLNWYYHRRFIAIIPKAGHSLDIEHRYCFTIHTFRRCTEGHLVHLSRVMQLCLSSVLSFWGKVPFIKYKISSHIKRRHTWLHFHTQFLYLTWHLTFLYHFLVLHISHTLNSLENYGLIFFNVPSRF